NQDVWIRTFPPPGSPAKQPEYRWQNPAMYQMLGLPADEQPDLHAALASSEPIVSANAAIALSRQHDAAGQQQLVRAVRNRSLKLALRRAAAEALAHLDGPEVPTALQKLEAEYGRFDEAHAASYLPELHAELLFALSRRVQPADAPCFTMAARSPAAEVRLAALECWAKAERGELPTTVADLRSDPTDRVRVAALRALAARHHPRALEWAKLAMGDYVLDVRLAAIAAAGSVGGAEAQAAIRKQLQVDSEIIRAAAVLAAADLHDEASVREGVADKSWRVRKVAAEMLMRQQPDDVRPLVRTLLSDRSAEVQRQTIQALEAWPTEAAGPILLEALGNATYLPRKAAGEQLARRWPPAAEFTADLPVERREEVITRLRQQWRVEHKIADPAVAVASKTIAQAPPPSAAELTQAEALMTTMQAEDATEDHRRAALDALRQFGPRLLPIVGSLRLEREQRIPEPVYRQLLPPLDAQFRTLELLASTDVETRRRASSDLAQAALENPLSPLVVDRIAGLGAAESDPLVCRWLLAAVCEDTSGLARPLLDAGISHPADEIRRLACEHLARIARQEDCDVLLPALADSYPPVVRAALRGLSRPGVLAEPNRLLVALRSTDKSVQLEAAVALARLGSLEGPPALERLAHDNDGEVRRQTAVAIGQLQDVQYDALLVELLDDPVARRAALESLPQIVGRDIAKPAEGPPLSLVERIDRWKHWWADQGRAVR
ncbi:MAG TPA: HEAT repeat domain-containing protein, partial [Pirellulales bacterium]